MQDISRPEPKLTIVRQGLHPHPGPPPVKRPWDTDENYVDGEDDFDFGEEYSLWPTGAGDRQEADRVSSKTDRCPAGTKAPSARRSEPSSKQKRHKQSTVVEVITDSDLDEDYSKNCPEAITSTKNYDNASSTIDYDSGYTLGLHDDPRKGHPRTPWDPHDNAEITTSMAEGAHGGRGGDKRWGTDPWYQATVPDAVCMD